MKGEKLEERLYKLLQARHNRGCDDSRMEFAVVAARAELLKAAELAHQHAIEQDETCCDETAEYIETLIRRLAE